MNVEKKVPILIVIVLALYFLACGVLFVITDYHETKTIDGEIVSIAPLSLKDRYNVSFSDGTTLIVDNYAIMRFDGYEGRMTIEFVRYTYHDSDYWNVRKLVKLDSWVKS